MRECNICGLYIVKDSSTYGLHINELCKGHTNDMVDKNLPTGKPCPHNWITCEWVESMVSTGRASVAPLFKVTKLYCTLCDTRKDIKP